MSEDSKFRPVVLVTGTGSGIGLEIVRKLNSINRYRIVATTKKSSLQRLYDQGFQDSDYLMIRPLDVTSYPDCEKVVREVNGRWGGVDILVNNAGISYRAVVEHMNEEEEHHQMETNYMGAMALIRLVLPHMRSKREGRIINISSVSGMMAMPTMSSYSASKFALEGASESLWYELRPWNIKVSLLQPGFIRSESFQHVYYSRKAQSCSIDQSDPYCRYYTAMTPFIEKLMNRSLTDAGAVADKVAQLIKRKNPPLRCPVTLDAYLFYWLRRLLPRRIYHRVLYHSLPGIKHWGKEEPAARHGPRPPI